LLPKAAQGHIDPMADVEPIRGLLDQGCERCKASSSCGDTWGTGRSARRFGSATSRSAASLPRLEQYYMPSVGRIVAAARKVRNS
jgi:hypothetical protein